MKSVKTWLLKEGRLIPDALDFIEQLCTRINESGISISRLRIGFETIHPQIDIWAYTWTAENNKANMWGGKHGIRTSPSYIGSPAQWVHTKKKTFRKHLKDLNEETDHTVLFEQRAAGATDYVMCPMIFMDRSNALISYVTTQEQGFSDEDISDLESLIDILTPIIEIHSTRKIAITLLDTYIGHRSGAQVMNGHIQRGDGEVIEAALWFCDLRQYTKLSETLDHLQLFSLLNIYFQTISDVIVEYGGEILKFIGDDALVIFPVDQNTKAQQACENALQAAQNMFERFEQENATRRSEGVPEIKFGIGLHFGEVIYGNVGAEDRLDFTVTGPAVNLTARLETLTKKIKTPLLLSHSFSGQLHEAPQYLGSFSLQGILEDQPVYTIPA